ncbi:MAG: stage III sporulation protein AA, partial [Firmicutes bacterium]|nr:stage III sporulation protein AA [Bacillota bacterium]
NVLSSVIISPPGAGKTTLLRDIIRKLGNMPGMAVGVVDERDELYAGGALDPGLNTDVLSGTSKAEGILMLLSSMGPKVIAVDEIGNKADTDALGEAARCGVSVICTLHGSSFSDVRKRRNIESVIKGGAFK